MSRAAKPDRLIAALRDSRCYGEATREVELIETHISWVFLVGEYAYKIKKPLDLGFLDFSTLERRRFFCEEEVRLNSRTASGLYLGVARIVATRDGLRVNGVEGTGEPIEYAVKMRRFPQDALADSMARRGAFGAAEADAVAEVVAAFHATLPPAPKDSDYGSPARVTAPAVQNFDQLDPLATSAGERGRLRELRDWTSREGSRLREVLTARKRDGFVRECHGDLHLGNIVFLDGRPTPFDGIEFDPELRWIDVVNEVAFLVMDLLAHRLDEAAWRLLNAYLEATGDYGGVRVLRYYLVYRAMVRAKIARIRACQPEAGEAARSRARQDYDDHLELARSLAASRLPAIVLMHGLSGSGKSSVAQMMLERMGAVRVRSDVERKRLHGLASAERTRAGLSRGIYTPDATRKTYDRLERLACHVAGSGYPVIVDAAFLKRADRDRFRLLAGDCGVPFLIVSCRASDQTLRERLARREAAKSDASEAGLVVLGHQRATQEPLGADEMSRAVLVDSEWSEGRLLETIDRINARLVRTE